MLRTMKQSGFTSSMFPKKLCDVQGTQPPITIKVLAQVVVSLIITVVHTRRLIRHDDMRKLPQIWYTDTAAFDGGATCAQVFVGRDGYPS